ncbi:MAG TPA: type II secretion system protein [Pyrinomonadaceae bacterium]|jgi:prepilin-type N-terminal cleavage/methylation domain-containing protein|nr:type II secretion system protein [Pyrinomonadaceae bacterium]
MNTLRFRLKDQRGFNLIELMIVIAIIGVLISVGAYAWAAMIRSGNETAAQQTLRSIQTYQAQYASKHKGQFAKFDELIRAGVMDNKFAGERPVVNGYVFTPNVEEQGPGKPSFYSINADPQVAEGVSATGSQHYYTDSNLGTIRVTDENRPAKAEDPSL